MLIKWDRMQERDQKRRREARNALQKGRKADGTTKRQARVESVKERG